MYPPHQANKGYHEICRLLKKQSWVTNTKMKRDVCNHMQNKTYCGNKLIHTVRRHTVEVCKVELQVDLIVEHVLA